MIDAKELDWLEGLRNHRIATGVATDPDWTEPSQPGGVG